MIPEKALQYIKDKKLQTSFSYKDIWNEEHATAFTVAKVMQVDILQDMKNAIEKAIENGETFESFKKNLLPTLEAKGWAGKKTMTDPLTGEKKEVYINTPRRLKTIYDTNLRSAYQKGRFEHAMESEMHPYLMYRLGPVKTKHRDEHSSWDGLILPKNDAWWNAHMPPNGYGCKCYVVAVTEDRKKKYENSGVPTAVRDGETTFIKAKTEAPKTVYRNFLNERKGLMERIPVGIQPGFNFNQGLVDRKIPIIQQALKKTQDNFPDQFDPIAQVLSTNYVYKEQYQNMVKETFNDIENHKKVDGNKAGVVGIFDSKIIKWLKKETKKLKLNINFDEQNIILLQPKLIANQKYIKGIGHHDFNAPLKEDWLNIMYYLNGANVYYDKGSLIYLYEKEKNKYLKIVVDATMKREKHRGSSYTLPKVDTMYYLDLETKQGKDEYRRIVSPPPTLDENRKVKLIKIKKK